MLFSNLDWLEKKFYTSINSMSMTLGICFLPPASKMCNNVDKKKRFDGKVGIIRNGLVGLCQANLVLIAYASSEGSSEPAHPRSLARTFAARSYKQ